MTQPESPRFPVWLGLVQGIALYALYKTHQEKHWPLEWGWLFNGALLSTLLLPFVAYWGQDVLRRPARQLLFLITGVLVFGLSAYQGAMVYPQLAATRIQLVPASTFFGLALLVFMAVPLTSGWARGAVGAVCGGWNYPRLFEHAWRNAVATIQACVLTGLLWAVLGLGAQLFHLIGVDWPKDTIEEKWFAIPITTLSIALGIRSGLRRAVFTVTLRNHWLTLTVWLLPLASFIGVAFVLTSLAGVSTLFDRGLSAFFLLWFAAFWIKFFNSAYQDGQVVPALHSQLRRALPYTAPALLAVVALAGWALFVRIQQHGLTPDRIWGVLAVGVALTYGIGYSLSLWQRRPSRWMPTIASSNIAAALVMSAGIALLLSPALDPNRLATGNQLSRLESGRVSADDFDVWALTRQGRAGHDALIALRGQRSAGGQSGKLAVRAEDAYHQAGYYQRSDRNDSDELAANLAGRIDVYPADKPIPAGFIEFLKQDLAGWEPWERGSSCFALHHGSQKCALLQIDLDQDDRDEMVLWDVAYSAPGRVYIRDQSTWRLGGHLTPEGGSPGSVRAELATNNYAVQPRRWEVLRVGKSTFQVFEKKE